MLNPLPSFLRASAQDAANAQMRKAGRQRWNDDDWNMAADMTERLVRQCYGRPSDHNNPDMCFMRFQIVEQMERKGQVGLNTDLAALLEQIDA